MNLGRIKIDRPPSHSFPVIYVGGGATDIIIIIIIIIIIWQ
jgi:hypothetical protein